MRVMLRSIIEPLTPDMIKTAQNGEEGLEQMEAARFDIVLCDYNLGKGKDGQQLLEEARHRELIGYATVYIMVTAENTSEMVMGAIDYLPDDYISKPFNRTVIHGRLKKILERKSNLGDISNAIAHRNYAKAVTLCDRLLAEKPSNQMDIQKTKCEMLLKLANYEQAIELCEKIIEQRDIPWAFMLMAKAWYMLENYMEAIETLENLVRENPSNVAAYDWLAKSYEAIGEMDKAQEALDIAVSKSPKSLVRQRRLAEVAYNNGNFEMAESAYERALDVGKFSCFKQADDYQALVKTKINMGKAEEAVNMVERIRNDFENNPQAEILSAVTESLILTEQDKPEAAAKALEAALDSHKRHVGSLSTNTALELTGLCLSHGKEDQANEIARTLVRNNHDNESLITQIKQQYSAAGKSDAGNALIENTKSEIVDLNNRGAKLLEEGKLEESIELFMKAARGMPDNIVVHLNTAYSIIMMMQKSGKIKKYMPRAQKYLERVHELDPQNRKYYELTKLVHKLAVAPMQAA